MDPSFVPAEASNCGSEDGMEHETAVKNVGARERDLGVHVVVVVFFRVTLFAALPALTQ